MPVSLTLPPSVSSTAHVTSMTSPVTDAVNCAVSPGAISSEAGTSASVIEGSANASGPAPEAQAESAVTRAASMSAALLRVLKVCLSRADARGTRGCPSVRCSAGEPNSMPYGHGRTRSYTGQGGGRPLLDPNGGAAIRNPPRGLPASKARTARNSALFGRAAPAITRATAGMRAAGRALTEQPGDPTAGPRSSGGAQACDPPPAGRTARRAPQRSLGVPPAGRTPARALALRGATDRGRDEAAGRSARGRSLLRVAGFARGRCAPPPVHTLSARGRLHASSEEERGC